MDFMTEIRVYSILNKYGLTFSEIDEIVAAKELPIGKRNLVFTKYMPRIRKSAAFGMKSGIANEEFNSLIELLNK